MSFVYTLLHTAGIAIADLCRPARVPGYSLCSRRERLRLDCRALGLFCRSVLAFRVLALWLVWQLAGHLLVWRFDLTGAAANLPSLTGLLWLLPALATARRRMLRRLLGHHWAGSNRPDAVL